MDFDKNYTCIGVIISPHGLKGGVKVKTYTHRPEAIKDFTVVYIEGHDEGCKVTTLQATSTKDCQIVYFEGILGRSMAENLKKRRVYVEFSQLPELAEEEYYCHSLVDCIVELDNMAVQDNANTTDNIYGTIIAMHDFGAGDIMEVARVSDSRHSTDDDDNKHSKATIMLPFNKDSVVSVDLIQKKIVYSAETVAKYE